MVSKKAAKLNGIDFSLFVDFAQKSTAASPENLILAECLYFIKEHSSVKIQVHLLYGVFPESMDLKQR